MPLRLTLNTCTVGVGVMSAAAGSRTNWLLLRQEEDGTRGGWGRGAGTLGYPYSR